MGEPEPRLFTLTEAERTRTEVEPALMEAMEARRKATTLEDSLVRLSARISLRGGLLVSYDKAAKKRMERDTLAEAVNSAIEQIEATGCVVKDLDVGLLDFPARLNEEDVYLCWRVGEDRIRFYHRQDEGFSSRKPIDPRDSGHQPPVQ
jgi:hypothetical protein